VRNDKNAHKKPMDRPRGQRFIETIPVRLTPALAKSVQARAERHSMSRSEAIRLLLESSTTRSAAA
jgi:hypothetical protein